MSPTPNTKPVRPAGYTAGPWHVLSDALDHQERWIRSPQGWEIAKMSRNLDASWANARLLAAAPDLVEALQALDASWSEDFPDGPDGDLTFHAGFGRMSDDTAALWRTIRAALAKALGQPVEG